MTVEDILQTVLPRLAGSTPTCSIFDAVRGVQNIIVNLLLRKRSDLLEQALELNYTSADTSVTLPDGYHSMSQRPVAGDQFLAPLHFPATGELLVPAVPRYYHVIGRALSIFPPPLADTALSIRAFVKPTIPTALDDVLPFQGAFDEAFVFGTQALMQQGSAVFTDRSFVITLESQVNEVLLAKNLSDEQMLADSINFP